MGAGKSRDRARQLRRDETDAERKLWARLRNRRFAGVKFRRQHRIGPFIADFCCVECRLVVELDGGQHATRTESDQRRTEFLGGQGYRVLRFWDNEVMNEFDAVLERIVEALRDPHPGPLPAQGEGELALRGGRMASVEYRGMNLIVPENDSEWKEYFEAARAHRLVMRACAPCGLMRYPPTRACPWCTALEWRWQEVSGRGTIYSYEIVVQAIQPGFRDWTPYPVVLVELDEQRGRPTADEGLRMIANLVTPDFTPEREANVAIGKRVRVAFQDLSSELALPQFTLVDEPHESRLWQFA